MIMTTPKDKKMVEVFDSKTNKNVFVSKDKVLEEKDRYEPKKDKQFIPGDKLMDKDGNIIKAKGGGLMEATAKLKAKGLKDGGMVVKDKVVAIDKSPNSGLITVKGFGAGRRT
jgi:hypothetical protein